MWRVTLVALIAGLAIINATGVYAQLVAAHVGSRAGAVSAIETQDAALTARIEVQTHTVADLDARVSQIDAAMPRQPSAVAPHRSSISSKGSARPVRHLLTNVNAKG